MLSCLSSRKHKCQHASSPFVNMCNDITVERELLRGLLQARQTFSQYQLQWTIIAYVSAFFRVKCNELVQVLSICSHAHNEMVSNITSYRTIGSGRGLLPATHTYIQPNIPVEAWLVDVWTWWDSFSWSSLGLLARLIILVPSHSMGWWCSQACCATADSNIPMQRRPGGSRWGWRNTRMLAAGGCWRSQLWQSKLLPLPTYTCLKYKITLGTILGKGALTYTSGCNTSSTYYPDHRHKWQTSWVGHRGKHMYLILNRHIKVFMLIR